MSSIGQASLPQIPGVLELPVSSQSDVNPLRSDAGGVIRIGNSRVSLDLVVEQYENGMTPEDMVRAYDTLDLADVHAAIAFYLRNRSFVEAYLGERTSQAEMLKAQIESQRPRLTTANLTQSPSASDSINAPTGQ